MAQSQTITQKKEFAKTLFLHENLTQQEISERVGVSRKTVNKWINDGQWESLKASITLTREEQLKNLYRQLAEINKAISERKESRFASPSEADTITKLSNAISKLETDIGIADIIAVLKKLTAFVRKISLEKAKELVPLFDSFLKDNLR